MAPISIAVADRYCILTRAQPADMNAQSMGHWDQTSLARCDAVSLCSPGMDDRAVADRANQIFSVALLLPRRKRQSIVALGIECTHRRLQCECSYLIH